MLKDKLQNETNASRFQPVLPAERIEAIDVLRGFAIFGVLIAYSVWSLGPAPFDTWGTADTIINFALAIIVDSKAYTLLAFLFGVGFSIQLARANERETPIVAVYCRRLLVLGLIGIVHALLLRNGDILVPYAAMGAVLLLFRNASNRTLIAAAFISSFVPYIAKWIWELTGVPYPMRPETEGMAHLTANLVWVKYWYSTAITLWPHSLPMFLIGLYVGRRRILHDPVAHRKILRRLLAASFLIGSWVFASWMAIIVMTEGTESPTMFVEPLIRYLWDLHAWGFAAFYASALLLLVQHPRWQRFLSPVASVGRMALTNYLLQSITIVPICVAFDLFDRVTPILGLLLAIAVWVVQVPVSVWWLKRFRFGPAEWLWRSLTYMSPQPMRLIPVRYVISNDPALTPTE